VRWRIFTVAAAVSLVMCLTFAVFWVRSKATSDFWQVIRRSHVGGVGNLRQYQCASDEGMIQLVYHRHTETSIRNSRQWPADGKVETERTWRTLPPASERGARFDTFLGFFNHPLRKDGFHVIIPHWFVVLMSGVLPLAWIHARRRRARRAAAGLCAACGYDLRASPERCPECGTAVPKGRENVGAVTGVE
jgi:hypothetical protein